MFCADYVASFIHHGIIVGLWCEYNKRQETDKHIDTDSISSVKSVFAGCLAGLFGAASIYPLDFVRQGAIIHEKVGFRHSLSTVPYAGAYFGLYFSCRDRTSTSSQCSWALLSSAAACLAEIPFDKAKQAMMGSRRTMVMVNMLYVPFGALMLVMYDKAMVKTIDTHYNNKQ